MYRELLKSKVHRARVTQADLHYAGSLTVDSDLMDAANLLAGERVDVVDVNNGNRFSTYVIGGPRGSGIIGVNGAAARLIYPGDLVIILSYGSVEDGQAELFRPRVVFVDNNNRPIAQSGDLADAPEQSELVRGDTLAQEIVFRDRSRA